DILGGLLLQVEDDRPLAAIGGDEARRHAVISAIGAVIAHWVADPGRLDLYNIRAERGQKMGREGTRHDMAEIGDADALERTGHWQSSRAPLLRAATNCWARGKMSPAPGDSVLRCAADRAAH